MTNRGRRDEVHVDVRNIVIPLWLGVSITLGFCGFIGTGLLAYVAVTTKVDLLIERQTDTWTKTDQKLWCLETEKANAGKWVCAGSGTVLPPALVTKRKAAEPAKSGFSLFGN